MHCFTPYWVHSTTWRKDVPVPCGKCPACKKRRVDSWAFRLMQEEKVSDFAHFVTLTYDTRFVPITKHGFMTLCKRDIDLFMKRLRKRCPGSKVKYYIAGEYGPETFRPHYHGIFFNVPNPDFFHDAWQKGGVQVGTVTNGSSAYCCKYVDKQAQIPMHARDDRQKEFSFKSNGLGLSYLTPSIIKYHQNDISRMVCTTESGYKIAMPSYYRKRIYSDAQRAAQIPIVEKAVASIENRQYQAWKLYYPGEEISFFAWQESIRLRVYHQFHQRQLQKARNTI